MPQLKTNTVTVTNGSNSVVGSGTAWLTGPNPVTVGAYLIISDENGGSPTVYEVQTIPSDTSLTLTTNWAGVTGTYNAVIHIDFLPNGVPQLTSGDLETVAVINRAHKILGDDIATGTAAATTTTRGTVEKATQGEMDAGTPNKYPSSAEVKDHIDGRKASSQTDATPDKFLFTGSGGINLSDSLNLVGSIDNENIPSNISFRVISPTNGGTFPPGYTGGILTVLRYNSAATRQIFRTVDTDSRVFERYVSTGVYPAWKEVIHTGNIVGTVSESGGVPTGSVMQIVTSGSNKAAKYADGKLITWNDDAVITADPVAYVGTPTSIESGKLKIGRWY